MASAAFTAVSTYNLFRHALAKIGIDFTFVEDPDNLEEEGGGFAQHQGVLRGEHRQSHEQLLDIRGVADVAHEVGVPLIIDNTVATSRADLPFESTVPTSWSTGHQVHRWSRQLDRRRARRCRFVRLLANDRFPGFTEPDPTYNGLSYCLRWGPGPTSSRPGS
ncbi:MAG: PLP-dependent transferase [Microthrixaceae bacterium]|nr:PLP-dependent transferase [Microthrixaceae bacterium]